MHDDNAASRNMTTPVVTLLAEQRLDRYTDRQQISSPEDAFEVVRFLLERLDREVAVVVSTDTRHRVLAADTLTIGTIDHTFMSPREIYRCALLRGASAIFVAHCHPSGDPTPSADDRAVTRRIAAAGQAVGVDLLDHLVVGDGTFVSLARLGVL